MELLAVIVILAIILVIAVPKVMGVIEDSKKATLESTVKMIASAAEKAKVQNTVLGKIENITCNSIAKVNDLDYENCIIDFDSNNNALVTIKGKGKFESLNVCNGTKVNAKASSEECSIPFEVDDLSIIVKKVKSGYYPYQVGDTRKIDLGDLGEHTIRVSNVTPCDGSLQSETACGFVLEFADIITTHIMNPSGEYNGVQYDEGYNVDGWPSSQLRTYIYNTIYNKIPDDIRNGIIDTTVISSHGADEDKNFISIEKMYLLSTKEVWGSDMTGLDSSATDIVTRQLDYYYKKSVTTTSYGSAVKNNGNTPSKWWLRSASSGGTVYFFDVNSLGASDTDAATRGNGISPAFRIG